MDEQGIVGDVRPAFAGRRVDRLRVRKRIEDVRDHILEVMHVCEVGSYFSPEAIEAAAGCAVAVAPPECSSDVHVVCVCIVEHIHMDGGFRTPVAKMLLPLGVAMLGLYGESEDEVYFGVTTGDAIIGETLAEIVCAEMTTAEIECVSRVGYSILDHLDGDVSWAPSLAMILMIGCGTILDEEDVWENVVGWVSGEEPRSLFHVIEECRRGEDIGLLEQWIAERMGGEAWWRRAAELIMENICR